jgi:hypothetical protein
MVVKLRLCELLYLVPRCAVLIFVSTSTTWLFVVSWLVVVASGLLLRNALFYDVFVLMCFIVYMCFILRSY